MKFKKEDLQELLFAEELEIDGKMAKIVLNEMCDKSRWAIQYELVFSYDDRYFMVTYSVGATEHQDVLPFEYAPAEIHCTEVHPVNVTKIEYWPMGAK